MIEKFKNLDKKEKQKYLMYIIVIGLAACLAVGSLVHIFTGGNGDAADLGGEEVTLPDVEQPTPETPDTPAPEIVEPEKPIETNPEEKPAEPEIEEPAPEIVEPEIEEPEKPGNANNGESYFASGDGETWDDEGGKVNDPDKITTFDDEKPGNANFDGGIIADGDGPKWE